MGFLLALAALVGVTCLLIIIGLSLQAWSMSSPRLERIYHFEAVRRVNECAKQTALIGPLPKSISAGKKATTRLLLSS